MVIIFIEESDVLDGKIESHIIHVDGLTRNSTGRVVFLLGA